MRSLARLLRRIIIFVTGTVIIAVGIILLVLPGPGILLIVAGLAILAVEFEWAKRHHLRIKKLFNKSVDKLRSKSSKVLLPIGGMTACLMNFLD